MTLRRILVALILAVLAACAAPMRRIELTDVSGTMRKVLVNRKDGRSLVMHASRIESDTILSGWVPDSGRIVRFPVSEVESVSVLRSPATRNFLLFGGIASALVFGMYALSGQGGDPQVIP